MVSGALRRFASSRTRVAAETNFKHTGICEVSLWNVRRASAYKRARSSGTCAEKGNRRTRASQTADVSGAALAAGAAGTWAWAAAFTPSPSWISRSLKNPDGNRKNAQQDKVIGQK